MANSFIIQQLGLDEIYYQNLQCLQKVISSSSIVTYSDGVKKFLNLVPIFSNKSEWSKPIIYKVVLASSCVIQSGKMHNEKKPLLTHCTIVENRSLKLKCDKRIFC